MVMDLFGDGGGEDPVALAAPGQAMQLGLIGGGGTLRDAVEAIPGLAVARQADPDTDGQAWRQVVNPSLIDALVIDVAPAWRSSMIQDALAVGVPVLCRGAVATDATEMDLIRRLAGMGGGLVMGWHPWLYDPAYGAMREIGGMIGPVRAIRVDIAVPETLAPLDLLWTHGADAVAATLEMLGGPADHCSAEADASGVLVRLVYKSEATAHIRLRGSAGEATQRFAVHHDQVVLEWRSGGQSGSGLSLHPPTPGFTPPPGPGEPIADIPAHGGPDMALRSFAHAVLEQDPQPQLLDFAADVVGMLDRAAADLRS